MDILYQKYADTNTLTFYNDIVAETHKKVYRTNLMCDTSITTQSCVIVLNSLTLIFLF